MIDQDLPKPSQPPVPTTPFNREMIYLVDHVAHIMQTSRRWVVNNMLKASEDGVKPCRHFRRGDQVFILGEWIQEWCRQGVEN